jgi:hypothetical protein
MSAGAAAAVQLLRIALASGDHAQLCDAARAAIEELSPPSSSSSTVLTPAALVARLMTRDNHLRIAVASDSESGKTVLICALARALLDAGLVKVVAALTADTTGAAAAYGAVLTAGCNFAWSEEQLASIIDAKEARKAAGKKNPPTLVILDDLGGEKVDKSASIATLYTRGRHLELIPVFLNQVANAELSPKVRGNSNIFLFSSLTPSGVTILYESFVLYPPMTKKELGEWVAELPRFTFGVYDRIDKSLSRIKATLAAEKCSAEAGMSEEELAERLADAEL